MVDVSLVIALLSSVTALLSSAWFVWHEGADDASVDRIRAGIEAELLAQGERVAAARLQAGMAAEAAGVERPARETPLPRWVDDRGRRHVPYRPRVRSAQEDLNFGLVASFFARVAVQRRRHAGRVVAWVTMWAALVHAVGAFWLPSVVVMAMAVDIVVLAAVLVWWWWWRRVDVEGYGQEWACFVEDEYYERSRGATYVNRLKGRHERRRERFLAEFGAGLAVPDFPDWVP